MNADQKKHTKNMRDHTLFFLQPLRLALLASLLLSLATGCSFFEPHKIVVSQGSWVDLHKVEQLELGMNKEQVHYLLGTPLLNDIFAPDTWIYSYRETIGTETLRDRRLKLDFENDSLVHMEKTLPEPLTRAAVSSGNAKTSSNNTKDNAKKDEQTTSPEANTPDSSKAKSGVGTGVGVEASNGQADVSSG